MAFEKKGGATRNLVLWKDLILKRSRKGSPKWEASRKTTCTKIPKGNLSKEVMNSLRIQNFGGVVTGENGRF